jgi:hypothetical protein
VAGSCEHDNALSGSQEGLCSMELVIYTFISLRILVIIDTQVCMLCGYFGDVIVHNINGIVCHLVYLTTAY